MTIPTSPAGDSADNLRNPARSDASLAPQTHAESVDLVLGALVDERMPALSPTSPAGDSRQNGESDYYDEHEEVIPALLHKSHWSCLDCTEPSWESTTDYSAPAHRHHLATGHRVNGSVEVRYRALALPFPAGFQHGAKEEPDA